MKRLLPYCLVLVLSPAWCQQTSWATEFQSSFIDISGLFGLNEPAQVTTINYQKKGLFVDGFHSFSWEEPGKTIQTFFSAGYQFSLDSAMSATMSFGNGFAFNRVAENGSFLRPVVSANWRFSDGNTLTFVSWAFLDTRKEALQPLNGGTGYVGYIFEKNMKKVLWRNEIRLLYSHVKDIRNVGGLTDQIRLTVLRSGFYFFANSGYSFYRSDHKREFIYNAGSGIRF